MNHRQLWLATAVIALTGCTETPGPVAPRATDGHAHDHPQTSVQAPDPTPSASQMAIEAEIRAGTARFHRVQAAIAEGYSRVSPCVSRAAGGMGYHYGKFSLIDAVIDPSNPEVLLYEPQEDGHLRLVAVEFIVPAAAWDPFNPGPPMLGTQPFDDGRRLDLGGPPLPHWQLHAWVWKRNPLGTYVRFNPRVTCAHAP